MTDAKPGFRIEHDSMGEVLVPEDALWGANTQRAVENFPVSGEGLPPHHGEYADKRRGHGDQGANDKRELNRLTGEEAHQP